MTNPYIIYMVKKGAPVTITLEGTEQQHIHGMPVDLSDDPEVILASFETLIEQIRAWEHEQNRSKS